MATTRNRELLTGLGVVSTLVDAAVEFTKGRRRSAVVLVGAAIASARITGFGTAVSVLMRLYRRLR